MLFVSLFLYNIIIKIIIPLYPLDLIYEKHLFGCLLLLLLLLLPLQNGEHAAAVREAAQEPFITFILNRLRPIYKKRDFFIAATKNPRLNQQHA